MTPEYLAQFIQAYAECALWSSTDESDTEDGNMGPPLDDAYCVDDIAPDTMSSMRTDCAAFIEANEADLEGMDPEQAGHDFWLTRNGHGAGFWDRGLGAKGDRLSDASHVYGSVYLYAHEGQVHA